MNNAWTIAVVVGASLAAVGCGDDTGSGGAGGGTTTTNGPTTTATTTTGASTGSSTGSSTASSTSATNGTTGPSTTAATTTGGGMAQFGESCAGNDDCESGVCHNFPNQGGMLCTLTCQNDNECPAPSSGCNMMGFCRPN